MKLYIKYMVSDRCKLAVKEELRKLGLHYIAVGLGEIEIVEDLSIELRERLKIERGYRHPLQHRRHQ